MPIELDPPDVMMDADDMLLWTVLRHRVRHFSPMEETHSQIKELGLTAAELHAAGQGKRRAELADSTFRTLIDRHRLPIVLGPLPR
jgi:hypothetical protein